MVGSRVLLFGVLIGLLLAGCAGFAYRYYGLEGIRYEEGKLLGPEPKYDRAFSDCTPTQAVKHPCVVMFAVDFFKFKTDYEDTKQRLEQCQHGVSRLTSP